MSSTNSRQTDIINTQWERCWFVNRLGIYIMCFSQISHCSAGEGGLPVAD